jgi:hypothetical protein
VTEVPSTAAGGADAVQERQVTVGGETRASRPCSRQSQTSAALCGSGCARDNSSAPARRAPLVGSTPAVLAFWLPAAPAAAVNVHEQAWAAYQAGDWALGSTLYQRLEGGHGHAGAGVAALNAGRPVEALSHLELAWMLAADDDARLDALFNVARPCRAGTAPRPAHTPPRRPAAR